MDRFWAHRLCRLSAVAGIACAALLSGCSRRGPHGNEVQVGVTISCVHRQSPVGEALVDLHGSQVTFGGTLDANGVAKLAVAPGSYRVTVNPVVPPPPMLMPGERSPPLPPRPDIPAAVRDHLKTPLTIEVIASGKNEFQFDLDKAAPPSRR